jgi:prevent-host-death family protein
MKTLAVAEVKTHLSALLKEVEAGHEIGITFGKRKETIAVIVPIGEYRKIKTRKLGTLEGKVSIEFKGEWSMSDEEFLNS